MGKKSPKKVPATAEGATKSPQTAGKKSVSFRTRQPRQPDIAIESDLQRSMAAAKIMAAGDSDEESPPNAENAAETVSYTHLTLPTNREV